MTNLVYGYMEVHMLFTNYGMGVCLVKAFVHCWTHGWSNFKTLTDAIVPFLPIQF